MKDRVWLAAPAGIYLGVHFFCYVRLICTSYASFTHYINIMGELNFLISCSFCFSHMYGIVLKASKQYLVIS